MILLIDNYDSFVFNLARYFQCLGHETTVARNDRIAAGEIRELAPRAIVLSPGPCTPNEAGRSLELVAQLWAEFPMLGVCLGHQTLAAAFGAEIIRAPEPMHGRTSEIVHDRRGVFSRLPNPLTVCRYHSLIVDGLSLPVEFEVSARTADGILMAFRHRQAPIVGVQFHPESILTDSGLQIVENFLRLAGLQTNLPATAITELAAPQPSPIELPDEPVTF